MIQNKLATSKKDLTNLLELAKCYQCIKQAVKKVSRNKYVQDWNAKQDAAQKNNGTSFNKAIVDLSASAALYVANTSSITLLIMMTLSKVVFAVLNTSIYTENTNAYGRKKGKNKKNCQN